MSNKIYKYTLYSVLSITLAFSAFLICSDNLSPFTTQATLHRTIANIAPQVSGVITSVNVSNGQQVHAGETLFSIDKKSYLLAVQQATAELHQAEQENLAKWQELQAAKQTLAQSKMARDNAHRKYARYQKLLSKGSINQQDVDDVSMSVNVANSVVESASADVLRIKAQLASDKQNANIELAKAKLQIAKLELARTDVLAEMTGTVSNLQLQPGSYINKGSVSLFLVNESSSWLSADFNEKGMDHLTQNVPVWVAFDALPNQLFEGKVINQDRAIFDPDNPTNQLSTVSNDTRWIREQQKIRIRIKVDQLNSALIAGSRASVLATNGNGVIDTLGYAWIKLVSLFRYLY